MRENSPAPSRNPVPVTDDAMGDLLIFAQALEAAHSSGFPFAAGLLDMARATPPGRVREWMHGLSNRLQAGNDLAVSVRELPGIDPLLAALLAIPSQEAVPRLLHSYERFLLYLQEVGERLRSVLLYPVIMLWLGLGNLFLVNFTFLPLLMLEYAGKAMEPPWLLQMLAVLDRGYWPLSLIFPVALAFLALEATRLFLVAGDLRALYSPLGSVLSLPEFVRREEAGRLLFTLSLLIEAGNPLPEALHQTADFAFDLNRRAELHLVGKALENGQPAIEAFALSPLLQHFGEGWRNTDAPRMLAERLHTVATHHGEEARTLLGRIPVLGLTIGLGVVGGVVLILGLAFFYPYFNLIGTP